MVRPCDGVCRSALEADEDDAKIEKKDKKDKKKDKKAKKANIFCRVAPDIIVSLFGTTDDLTVDPAFLLLLPR